MSKKNLVKIADDGIGSIVDRMIHRDEDVFERHARKANMRQDIGSPATALIIPGYGLTQMVKYAWNIPNLTKRQRTIYLANSVAAGLTVEIVKGGVVYLVYEFWKYTHK